MKPAIVLAIFAAALALAAELPARISNDGISMILPDGWRRLDNAEATKLRAAAGADARENDAILLMKHDAPGSDVAAAVQVFHKKMPKDFEKASALDLAKMIARYSARIYRAALDGEPHARKVAGREAAEWSASYTIVETNGTKQPMVIRQVIIVMPNQMMYSIGYSGPANDASKFDTIVDSIMIE